MCWNSIVFESGNFLSPGGFFSRQKQWTDLVLLKSDKYAFCYICSFSKNVMFCRNKAHSSFVASVIYKLKPKLLSKLNISQEVLLAFKKQTVSFHVLFQLYVGQ